MLIQAGAGARLGLFVQSAFRFGSAEPGGVGIGVFCRLLSLEALLESLQVDHIPHARPSHPAIGGRATFSRAREWSRWALIGSVVIQKYPHYRSLILTK